MREYVTDIAYKLITETNKAGFLAFSFNLSVQAYLCAGYILNKHSSPYWLLISDNDGDYIGYMIQDVNTLTHVLMNKISIPCIA